MLKESQVAQSLYRIDAPEGNSSWIFPGQGGITVGLGGKEFEESPQVRKLFEVTDKLVGGNKPFSDILFNGPQEELSLSPNAHVALLSVGIAKLIRANETGSIDAKPNNVIECSAGIVPALVASGVLPYEVGVDLALARGKYTQEASEGLDAGMQTIISVNSKAGEIADIALKACYEDTKENGGVIAVSGMYSPTAIGMTGDRTAMERVNTQIKDSIKNLRPQTGILIVSHSPYMRPAAEKLAEKITGVVTEDPWYPLAMNGEIETKGYQALRRMPQELLDPVRLTSSVEMILNSTGMNEIIEFENGVNGRSTWARFVAEQAKFSAEKKGLATSPIEQRVI